MLQKKVLVVFISCIVGVSFMSATNLQTVQRGIQRCSEILSQFSGIETDRLVIRKLEVADIDDVFVFTSDSHVTELTTIFEIAKTKDDVKKYIENIVDNYTKGIPDYWAIVYKENSKVVGIICIDISSRYRGDIAYAIARDYWSKGIATEAAGAVIDFGFKVLGLKRIDATCDPRNIASVRVLKKCGMRYEGLLKSYSFMHGSFCDRELYAIISE
jgi:ribosomal-protein-alanine N-acetyltransferase